MDGFKDYLPKVLTSQKDQEQLYRSAKEHHEILATRNASELHSMSKDVRRNCMRALVHLAKFNGCYGHWQGIVKQNGLKWKQADDSFNFFEKESITDMLGYMKQIIKTCPGEYANTFIFATLAGLRPCEACQAIRLIREGSKDYFNPDLGVLEHFRRKDIFVWRSKKAFISLANTDLLDLARVSCDSYPAMQSAFRRRNVDLHSGYGRKIFATWLRQKDIETEFMDLLQGRTPSGIFAKHYFRPSFKEHSEKVRSLIASLAKEVESP
jgi:hypothetical protein